MNIQMTYNEAIKIQEEQIEHYTHIMGDGVRAKVKALTLPCPFNPDELRPTWDINPLVPRGGTIESILGIYQNYGD